MTTIKYSLGQKVKGKNGAGTRTIVSVRKNKIGWKSGERTGVCSERAFQNWQLGRNTAAYRNR